MFDKIQSDLDMHNSTAIGYLDSSCLIVQEGPISCVRHYPEQDKKFKSRVEMSTDIISRQSYNVCSNTLLEFSPTKELLHLVYNESLGNFLLKVIRK